MGKIEIITLVMLFFQMYEQIYWTVNLSYRYFDFDDDWLN